MSAYTDSRTDAVEIEIPEPPQTPRGAQAQKPVFRPTQESSGISAGKPESVPRPTGVSRPVPAKKDTVQASAPSKNNNRAYTYRPENGLIESVTVYPWHTDYSYYEQFRATALRLMDLDGEPCEPVPFFSYMPQYSQLTAPQLSWYLYLRSEIIAGRYPEAEYTYLLLLIYETINLSDVNEKSYTLRVLCNILTGYGRSNERILLQLSDWLCDFCLISGCVPPGEQLKPFLDLLAHSAFLKEFYIGLGCGRADSATVLKYASGYDYTKSRFASGASRPLYDRHMNGVLEYIISHNAGAEAVSQAMLEKFTCTRDAYVGALCSPHIKKRLVISYFSFSKSHELRFLVTDILKYTENRLRRSLGLRSKLSHGPLPEGVKKLADAYLDANLPENYDRHKEEVPEYEKLYEPAPSKLTAEAAAAIEAESWLTTEKLLEAFGGTDFGEADETVQSEERMSVAAPDTDKSGSAPVQSPADRNTDNSADFYEENGSSEPVFADLFTDFEKNFICAALENDRVSEKTAAKAAGLSPQLMADGINEKAADSFGDIILEEKDGFFAVIEDYTEEIREVLRTPSSQNPKTEP